MINMNGFILYQTLANKWSRLWIFEL